MAALFFNACTGILSGSNKSGELLEPSRAIPKGTLAAIFTSTCIYAVFIILYGSVGNHKILTETHKHIVSAELSWPWPVLVQIGIIVSSSGAALQSMAGAPRIIQAIVDDDLLPKRLNFLKSRDKKNPIQLPILFTSCFVSLAILSGSLNAVAPLVSIFFLLTYAGVNVSCYLQDYLGSPNWRPKFKYSHPLLSFSGTCICIVLMVTNSILVSLLSLFGAFLLYKYLEDRS